METSGWQAFFESLMNLSFWWMSLYMFIPVIVGLFTFKRIQLPYKLLVVLICTSWLVEISIYPLYKWLGTNHHIHHILLPINLILLGLIYYHIYKPRAQKRVRLWLVISMVCCLLFLLVNTLFIQPIYEFASNGLTILCFFAVVNSLFYFRYMLKNPTDIPILNQPQFWFNSANLIFYSITLFVFGFRSELMEFLSSKTRWSEIVIQTANVLLYFGYSISLVMAARSRKISVA